MSLLQLYFVMARIGLFTFGGGYAMIPLFQQELVERYALLSGREFINIVAIAQMTPGPIAVNAATYVGYHHSGVFGAVIGTLGMLTPSLLIITLIARGAKGYAGHHLSRAALRGIRPVIVGLIASALLFFIDTSLIIGSLPLVRGLTVEAMETEALRLNLPAVAIFAAALLLKIYWRWSVLRILLVCAALGTATTLLPT